MQNEYAVKVKSLKGSCCKACGKATEGMVLPKIHKNIGGEIIVEPRSVCCFEPLRLKTKER